MDEQEMLEALKILQKEVKDLEWRVMFWRTLDEIHYKRAFIAEQELQKLYMRVWELESNK